MFTSLGKRFAFFSKNEYSNKLPIGSVELNISMLFKKRSKTPVSAGPEPPVGGAPEPKGRKWIMEATEPVGVMVIWLTVPEAVMLGVVSPKVIWSPVFTLVKLARKM